MRICLDLSAVASPGSRLYAINFVPALAKAMNPVDELLVLWNCEAPGDWDSLPTSIRIYSSPWFRTLALRLVWLQTALPAMLIRERVDVLFAAFDLAPAWCPARKVVAIRNPMPARPLLDDGEPLIFAARNAAHRVLARASVSRADAVIYSTVFAARTLGPKQGVETARCQVVPHGVDHDFWSRRRDPMEVLPYGLQPGKYFLHVSQFYPYKRPGLVLEAFERLCDDGLTSDWHLVFTGDHHATAVGRSIAERASRSRWRDRFRLLGLIERERVPALFQHAAASVMMSRLETFGHPLTESMAAGCPVICARLPFTEELCGESALYCDDPQIRMAEIAAGLVDRVSIVARARAQVSRFSWNREARETLAILRGDPVSRQ